MAENFQKSKSFGKQSFGGGGAKKTKQDNFKMQQTKEKSPLNVMREDTNHDMA